MRKLTIQLTASVTLLLLAAFALQSFKFPMKIFQTANVDFTFTTSGGCTVNILGGVDYTTPPLVVNWASGRVSLSGRCKPGTGTADLYYEVITDAHGEIIDIIWHVPESGAIEGFLAEPEIEDAFKAYLQQLLI
jgi:hypothetical protein